MIYKNNIKYRPTNTLNNIFYNYGYILVILIIIIFSIICMFVPISNIYNDEGIKSDTMNKCENKSCYQFGLLLLIFFIVLCIFMSFNRIFPNIGFIIIIILSIASVVYVNIGENSFDDEFEIAKFYLIILASLFLSFTRVAGINNFKLFNYPNIWSWLLFGVLVFNILAAVGTEIKNNSYINPIIGIILILMLPNPITYGKQWKDLLFIRGNDLVYKISMFWMLMYTIWDMNFVYKDGKEHFASVIIVLLTPLLTGFPLTTKIDPGLYIQARTYTLFLRYIILAFNDVFEKYSDSNGFYLEKNKNIWDYVDISVIIMYIIINLIF